MGYKNHTASRSEVPTGWLLSYLNGQGLSRADITDALGYQDLFDQNDPMMVIGDYYRLIDWSALRLNDPALGIHVTEIAGVEDLGVLGYLVKNAATLRDWSEILSRYHRIFAPDFLYTFQHSRKRCRCEYQVVNLQEGYNRHDVTVSLASVVRSIREQFDLDWHPLKCGFTHPAPEDKAEFIRYFGPHLLFDQASNYIDVEEAIFDTPISDADPNLLVILKRQADQLLDQLEDSPDLVRSVQLLIVAGLGHEHLNTKNIASKVNMSERNFRRHLSEANTSFREIKDNTLLMVAKKALLESDASVTKIAIDLGYSEASAFVRVFKRLVGVSPLQYRRRSQQ
ncbi:MAG: AraC family transcriptional regulator ligand-binding domain-containing protein [Pseudomonadota bacterium]